MFPCKHFYPQGPIMAVIPSALPWAGALQGEEVGGERGEGVWGPPLNWQVVGVPLSSVRWHVCTGPGAGE